MQDKVLCSTCNMDVSVIRDSVAFKCPECGKREIRRCGNCRNQAVKYSCECGFTGP